MKELNIEAKAKAYDEALERAKKEWSNNLDNAYKNYRERLEIIFPELAESEDEKIRKALIGMFRGYHIQKVGDFTDKDILAWLERQGTSDKTSCESTDKDKKWKEADDYNANILKTICEEAKDGAEKGSLRDIAMDELKQWIELLKNRLL